MKKILFMGTPQFSAQVLKGIINAGYEVVGVVTQPDRPVGRKKVLTPPPVKVIALEHIIPIFQPEKLSKSQEMAEIMDLEFDLIVTAAYGQFVPTKLLNYPAFRAINVHASLLPKYRGGAPIHYAIWNGDKETGISIMYMEKEMDAGDILSQASIAIDDHDDVGSMFEKLAVLGRDLLLETLPKLFANEITPQKQNPSQVTFSPTIKKEEEELDWRKTAQEIYNHIRAFRPFPSTYTRLNDQRIKIWDVSILENPIMQAPFGTILELSKAGLLVQCQNSQLLITSLQPSGKKQLTIEQWMNGLEVSQIVGQQFALKEVCLSEN